MLSLIGLGAKKKNPEHKKQLMAAVLQPQFHHLREDSSSRYLNVHVRYLFDSKGFATEMETLRARVQTQFAECLTSILCREAPACFTAEGELIAPMKQEIDEYLTQCHHEANSYAMRKTHQLTALSQSVLQDQRNHLLASKVILLAHRNHHTQMLQELTVFQLGVSPVDAFAAKLLDDAEHSGKSDSADLLCFASLAEGIRKVAISQLNHFFQTRRFEQERAHIPTNSIGSDEIAEQLGLDLSLVAKFDMLSEQHSMPNMMQSSLVMSDSPFDKST